jgi:hypothetical protein
MLGREAPVDSLLPEALTVAEFVATSEFRSRNRPHAWSWARCVGRHAGCLRCGFGRSLGALEGCELAIAAERGNALRCAARLANVWLANAH